MNNNCAFEIIIETINKLEAEGCVKCSPCREGRRWLKNLLNNASDFANEKDDFFNFLVEMSYQISQLSNCPKGKKFGSAIMSHIINNKLDINFHLESNECRTRY
jgi:NADH:ubiquinone oxidoreductase subunit F (NADH-binding)